MFGGEKHRYRRRSADMQWANMVRFVQFFQSIHLELGSIQETFMGQNDPVYVMRGVR